MNSDQVQQIIDMFKGASPVLWSAAQHQVQADIISDYLLGGIFLLLTCICIVASVMFFRIYRRSGMSGEAAVVGITIATVVGICTFICVLVCANDLIYKLGAPDYAAIQHLSELVP